MRKMKKLLCLCMTVPGFISGVQYKKSRTVGWGDGRSAE